MLKPIFFHREFPRKRNLEWAGERRSGSFARKKNTYKCDWICMTDSMWLNFHRERNWINLVFSLFSCHLKKFFQRRVSATSTYAIFAHGARIPNKLGDNFSRKRALYIERSRNYYFPISKFFLYKKISKLRALSRYKHIFFYIKYFSQ